MAWMRTAPTRIAVRPMPPPPASPPDVFGQAMVGAPRARLEFLLSRIRRDAEAAARTVPRDRLRALGAAGGGRRKSGQGRVVRLPDVRSMPAEPHRHVLSDELPEDLAQRAMRRRARRRQLRG